MYPKHSPIEAQNPLIPCLSQLPTHAPFKHQIEPRVCQRLFIYIPLSALVPCFPIHFLLHELVFVPYCRFHFPPHDLLMFPASNSIVLHWACFLTSSQCGPQIVEQHKLDRWWILGATLIKQKSKSSKDLELGTDRCKLMWVQLRACIGGYHIWEVGGTPTAIKAQQVPILMLFYMPKKKTNF